MRQTRALLLIASTVVVVLLLGGGLAAKVGADTSAHQARLFADVLKLVLDNYVDPVQAEALLSGAYEGMLGGLDPQGAYLTAEEVARWKAQPREGLVGFGVTVLKAGSGLQIVAVEPGSPAEQAGLSVGDHIRNIAEKPVRDLSLGQSLRLILGPAGSTVVLDVMHMTDDFRRERMELVRAAPRGKTHALAVERGIAVLKIHDPARLAPDALAAELDEVRSRATVLLLDLRNLAGANPREVAPLLSLFTSGTLLELRDRSGRLLDSLQSKGSGASWPGKIAVLVNGATAGSGEALAEVLKSARSAVLLGEPTYGLGGEPRLYELENGAGVLIAASFWETPSGQSWMGEGLKPDEVLHGKGENYQQISDDQLNRALDFLEQRERAVREQPKAA